MSNNKTSTETPKVCCTHCVEETTEIAKALSRAFPPLSSHNSITTSTPSSEGSSLSSTSSSDLCSSSSAARPSLSNNLGRGGPRRGRRTVSRKGQETVWVGDLNVPIRIRAPATQTFLTALSRTPAPLQQAAGFVSQSFGFEMSQVDGGADYLGLFDSYRFLKVEAVIRPTVKTGVQGFSAPIIYTVVDLDDSNALSTASQFREYGNVVETMYESINRCWVPYANMGIFVSAGAASGYSPAPSPWIDAATVNVDHFGLKVGMDGGSGIVPQVIEITFRFLVEWRCTR